jgi:predicted Zn-dependent protease
VSGGRGLAVAAVALLAAAACTVSEDQEVAIGRDNAAQVGAQLPLVTDGVVNAYVTGLGTDIASRTSRADLQWHFYVVNSPEVNAFALPGGYVYVNRGLIERAARLDELAGVLGHENAHDERLHGAQQLESQQRSNAGLTLVCTLTRVCESDAARVAINVGGAAYFARHSRLDESQADSEAVENLIRTGIDPDGIPAMFERLIAERSASPTVLDVFFASHPLEEQRVRRTRALIATYDPSGLAGLVQDTPEYHAFQSRLAALPRPAQPRSVPGP